MPLANEYDALEKQTEYTKKADWFSQCTLRRCGKEFRRVCKHAFSGICDLNPNTYEWQLRITALCESRLAQRAFSPVVQFFLAPCFGPSFCVSTLVRTTCSTRLPTTTVSSNGEHRVVFANCCADDDQPVGVSRSLKAAPRSGRTGKPPLSVVATGLRPRPRSQGRRPAKCFVTTSATAMPLQTPLSYVAIPQHT